MSNWSRTRSVAESPSLDTGSDSRPHWSPLVVFITGGATLVAVGLSIWSGLDAMNRLHDFEARPTQGILDSGRAAEVRTNVLLGTSIGCQDGHFGASSDPNMIAGAGTGGKIKSDWYDPAAYFKPEAPPRVKLDSDQPLR